MQAERHRIDGHVHHQNPSAENWKFMKSFHVNREMDDGAKECRELSYLISWHLIRSIQNQILITFSLFPCSPFPFVLYQLYQLASGMIVTDMNIQQQKPSITGIHRAQSNLPARYTNAGQSYCTNSSTRTRTPHLIGDPSQTGYSPSLHALRGQACSDFLPPNMSVPSLSCRTTYLPIT